MFWLGLFWTSLFWTGSSTLTSASYSSFEYNWYVFWNTVFRLTNIPDFHSAGNILFETYDIALANGGGFDGYKIKPKRLIVEGVLTADSASDLESAIDQMKYTLLQSQKTLTYTKQNGVVLQTIASCTNITIKRLPYHITYVPVSIEFTILSPFLYGVNVTEVTNYGNTSNFSGTCTVIKWDYEAYPVCYITYNSASSCTSLSLDIGGAEITINKTFSNGDIIIIDSKNKLVTVNSVSGQDYEGEFQTLPLGDVPYSVTSDGTFNIDLVIQRYDTYV